MAQMTIHRALSELKLIDAKITKQTMELVPLGIYQKGKLVNGHIKEEDFKSAAQSKFDSVKELIERKTKIKAAVVAKNGVTKVIVASKEMTIADAITFKGIVALKKQLIERIKAEKNKAVAALNQNNDLVNANVQRILEATFGKENVKAGKDDIENVRKPYLEANEFHLFDPLDTVKQIESLEKEVSEFEAEVDAVLSEINAITFIDI